MPQRNLKGGRERIRDDRGQPHDGRVQFFDAVAAACREAGRSIPVFIDKHAGATWEQASHVYETARELEMPSYGPPGAVPTWRKS